MSRREGFIKIYNTIIDTLTIFTKQCNDENSFELAGIFLGDLKGKFEYLNDEIHKYNEKSSIIGEKEIDFEEWKKLLCKKLNEIPNINELLIKHQERANQIVKNYTDLNFSYKDFNNEKRINELDVLLPISIRAKTLLSEKEIELRYSKINTEIYEFKNICCFKIKDAAYNLITLKIEHQENDKLEKFRTELVNLNYLDDENSKLFISLLKGNYSGGVIDWKITQAKISRLIYAIKNLLEITPSWDELQKLFTTNGNILKSLKTGSMSKKADEESENIVNILS
ncbi:MAG: hypothetical protein JNL65_08155 [Saprospiraceae bacterium]|nr:hypothetical protein [Saprospiraceae bacterium]